MAEFALVALCAVIVLYLIARPPRCPWCHRRSSVRHRGDITYQCSWCVRAWDAYLGARAHSVCEVQYNSLIEP